MGKRGNSRGRKALNGALKILADPQSDLHKRVKRSLAALDASHKQLGLRFADRARKREDEDSEQRDASLAEAQAYLPIVKAHAVAMKKLNDEGVTKTAEAQVKTQELIIDSFLPAAAAQRASLTSIQNAIEEGFRGWNDLLVARAVDALHSDTAGDQVVAILSGPGLIVVGVAGGPVAAAMATAASAGFQVADAIRKLDRASSTANVDQEVARVERALISIDGVKNLTNDWLTIFQ